MTRPAHWPPAGEPEVHPLPPAPRDPFPCSCSEERLCAEHVELTLHQFALYPPPPVQVIRLAGKRSPGAYTDEGSDDATALAYAAYAVETTAGLIPFLTMPASTWTVENGDEERAANLNATRARVAARFARLALGVSS